MRSRPTRLLRLLAKVGARHSKADKERIKKTHDLLVELDPDCCAGRNHRRRAMSSSQPQFSPQAGERWDDADGDAKRKNSPKFLERSLERSLAKALSGFTARMDDFAGAVEKNRGSAAAARRDVGAGRREERGLDFPQTRSLARSARRARGARRSRHPQGAGASRCAPFRVFERARSKTPSYAI